MEINENICYEKGTYYRRNRKGIGEINNVEK